MRRFTFNRWRVTFTKMLVGTWITITCITIVASTVFILTRVQPPKKIAQIILCTWIVIISSSLPAIWNFEKEIWRESKYFRGLIWLILILLAVLSIYLFLKYSSFKFN